MFGRLAPRCLIAFIVAATMATTAEAQVDEWLVDEFDFFRQNPNEEIWQSYTNWSGKLGNDRTLGEGELFLSLWQDDCTLLFADFRVVLDDDQGREGNFGLGMRSFIDDEWIFGAYGYFDLRRTPSKNRFQQATFGMEFLSVDWDYRMNAYLPEDDEKTVAGTGLAPQAALANGTIVVRSAGASTEKAYYGFDAEIGALLGSWGSCNEVELRGFLGGYYFNADSGFPEIAGPRLRSELRLFDVPALGNGSRVELASEVSYDRVRDWQGFLEMRVRIPLNFKGHNWRRMSQLERRMVDRIVRDVDIVSHVEAQPVIEEPAINPLTGRQFGALSAVNSDSGNLATLLEGADANSTIFVDGTTGTFDLAAGEDIDLNAGQQILGGGQTITVQGSTTSQLAQFAVPGTRPTVDQADGGTNIFELANNSFVSGFDLTGGADAISAVGSSNAAISNVSITGIGGNAIVASGGADLTIRGITVDISGAGQSGLVTSGASNSIDLRDSSFTVDGAGTPALSFTGTGDIVLVNNVEAESVQDIAIVAMGPGTGATGHLTIANSDLTSSAGFNTIFIDPGAGDTFNVSILSNRLASGGAFGTGTIFLDDVATSTINVTQLMPSGATDADELDDANGIPAGNVTTTGAGTITFGADAPDLP